MNPPFSITIEITEARQCHAAVSQLLRVFPSLSLTITANERISTPPCTAQAALDAYYDSAYIARALDAIGRTGAEEARLARDVAFRIFTDADTTYRAAEARWMGADEARKAADGARCATPSDGKSSPSYPWKPGEHTEAAADSRIEADAAAAERDWRNDNSDAGYDDTNSNGR